MGRATSFIFSIGIILVLTATLLKELKWHGEKAVLIAAICVLLTGMGLYMFNLIRHKARNIF